MAIHLVTGSLERTEEPEAYLVELRGSMCLSGSRSRISVSVRWLHGSGLLLRALGVTLPWCLCAVGGNK